MKPSFAISCSVTVALCACEMINRPLSSSGDFDPMRSPGSRLGSVSSGPGYKPGEFVSAMMDNTGFYKSKPKGDANADKLLKRGASMKVVSSSDSFLKVELDSGEIGFVPTVMVAAPGAAVASGPFAANGAVQVYPPIDGSFAAPVPALPDGALPPDGVIPTVIDPNAPPPNGPLPPVSPTTDTFPVPPTNPPAGSAPAPLPPNEEDLAKGKTENPAPAPKLEEKKESSDPVPPVQPKIEGN